MDPQDNAAGRKIPIEHLNKEELVKKYRQAILIAQKAKESKTELLKHVGQHEELVRTLEERLRKLEAEKILEADLRAELEKQLEQSRKAIQLSENQKFSEEADVKDADRSNEALKNCCEELKVQNSRLVSELEDSSRKIEVLESELQSMKNQICSFSDTKVQLDNVLEEKERKIKLLQETMKEEKEMLEKCQSELRFKIQTLEKSMDQERIDHDNQVRDINFKLGCLQELVNQKEEEIKKQENEAKGVKLDLEEFQKELKENQSLLSDKEETILHLVSQVEELKISSQEMSTSPNKENLTEEMVNELRLKIDQKDHEISQKEECIARMSSELQEVTNCLSQVKHSLSESASKSVLLQSENECYLQQISSLESENAKLNHQILKNNEEVEIQERAAPDLQSQLQQVEKELGEKHNLLMSSNDSIEQLNSQVKELITTTQDQASCVQNLTAERTRLEHEIIERDTTIAKLSLEVKELTILLDSQKLELMDCSSKMGALKEEKQQQIFSLQNEMGDLVNQLRKTNEDLEEKKREFSELQETCRVASQCEIELREQLDKAQDSLQKKELALQDLEQEVYRLKDAAANECNNTEVSSTFSLSRAEEQSRLRDLEDSFEDKYTKLRVVAVKLKRRVTELTQTLEDERSKMATEKSDLQAKISQVASQAKTLQTLQSEVDRLQDLLEEQKKANVKLNKDLDSAVREVSSSKSELAAYQEELDRLKKEKLSLETAKSNLESALTQAEAISSETGRLCKELKEKDILIENCKEERKKLTDQLERAYADAKKKGVLSLEMADMEKSVSELTRQLNIERDRLKICENELEQERSLSLTLQDDLRKGENQLQEKEVSLLQLKDLLSLAKEECNMYQGRCKEKESLVEQLTSQLEKERSSVEELNIQCSDLAAKLVQTKENARLQIETLSRQVFQLEEQHSALRDSYKALEDELTTVQADFENYKVRAQSVLRQSAKQEDRNISSSTVQNAEELEVEVEHLRVNISNVKANLKQTTLQLQAAMQEVNAEREEKVRALKLAQSAKESCAQAIEKQHITEERLSVVVEEAKQAKLHSEMLIQCYKQQIEDLKATHQKKVASLTEQIENLQASMNSPEVSPVEGDQASGVISRPSPVSEWAVQLPNHSHSDPEMLMRLSTLQREEGEGSESVDSFPLRRISVSTQERRHQLVPLDKLLSSPSYPEDNNRDAIEDNSSELNINLLQSKLSACESRAAHLTALLSEAESDAARLSQLNAVLKEEIRRQQRSEERAQHAHNLEYLKNIVVKFITLQNGDERQRLVPVLNTILKLSPEEAGLIASVAKGNTQANTSSRGWGNYLHLPGWNGS